MEHSFSFTFASMNGKTGPIPVSGTSRNSCPDSCPLKNNGCYAELGPIRFHWNKLSRNGGLSLEQLTRNIRRIQPGNLWRHNQFGDLPGNGQEINEKDLNLIVKANKGRRGFTYTHYSPTNKNNAKAISEANKNGFTINLSADNLNEADEFADLGIAPVVTILPIGSPKVSHTPKGKRVFACPASYSDVQCIDCGLCQKPDRKDIVGFFAHGVRKKIVSNLANFPI